jgi:hypothetical protein
MRPVAAHSHLGLGRIFHRSGHSEHAREHLATATTMFREMDVDHWVEQAEMELTDHDRVGTRDRASQDR